MNRRSTLMLCALTGIAAFCLGAANSQEADKEPAKLKDLLVSQAQGYQKLAELSLESAQNSNKQAPGSISKFMIEALQLSVEAARERVKMAQSGEHGNLFADMKGTADLAVKIAEADLARATKPDGFPLPETDIARLKAKLEIARSERDIMQQLSSASMLDQLEWLVGRQAFVLSDLDTRVEALEARP